MTDQELQKILDRADCANPGCSSDQLRTFAIAARTDLPRVIAELREARNVIDAISKSIGDTCAIAAITNGYLNRKEGKK
jgi:hypothetical protein